VYGRRRATELITEASHRCSQFAARLAEHRNDVWRPNELLSTRAFSMFGFGVQRMFKAFMLSVQYVFSVFKLARRGQCAGW